MKSWLSASRFETLHTKESVKEKARQAIWLALSGFVVCLFSSTASAQIVNSDERLRDSCHAFFKSVRDAESNVRAIESQSVRMVRLGGNPDVALYERLYKVHLAKVTSAKAQLRQHESALSGCLANALRDKSRGVAEVGTSGQVGEQTKPTSAPIVNRHEVRSPASQAVPVYATPPAYTPPSRGTQTVR